MRIVSSLYLKLVVSSVLALASISGLAQNAPKVEMKTNMGEIVIEVYPDKAPLSADNFLKYIKTDFARFCLSLMKTDKHVNSKMWIVPFMDFSQEWTEDKLYSYFGITKEEQETLCDHEYHIEFKNKP